MSLFRCCGVNETRLNGDALATTSESAVLIAARTKVVLGPLLLLLNSAAAEATEIHILAPTTIRPVINVLAPEFEHTTGYKLVVAYDVAPIVKRQVEGGAAFDLVIVTLSGHWLVVLI